MKKIVLALVLLVAGILFIIQYLAGIADMETSKVADNAVAKLMATGNKSEPSQKPAKTENKPTDVVEQVTDTITPVIKKATEIASSTSTKAPIATIKIYDKKTNKETLIDTSTLLTSEQNKLSAEQQEKLQQKAAKFRDYYQKPEKCLSPATKEIRVQCANEYMRAKAKFEQLYQQDKL